MQILSLTDKQMKDRRTINKTVEHRNFHWWVQQPGESFNDFLITIRELVKTCKFCSDTFVQKSIHDQIIEGLTDGGTIDDLLQDVDLTLATTTTKWWGREAAFKSRSNVVVQDNDTVANLWKLPQTSHQFVPSVSRAHRGECRQCPAYNWACLHCYKLEHFGKVFQGK